MSLFIDCVKSPSITAMRAAGVTGVSRYLSTLDDDPLGKIIHKTEYDALIAAGFDVVLNWEHSARDWLGGAAAGKSHAAQAVSQARALGYPAGCVIIGSADFDMTASQWASSGRAYAQAYSAGIRAGEYAAGVYGPSDVLGWCKSLGGFAVYWQSMSTAFSAGRNKAAWPGAHLRQRRSTTIGGTSVDVSDILQARYGQAPVEDDDMQADERAAVLNTWYVTQQIAYGNPANIPGTNTPIQVPQWVKDTGTRLDVLVAAAAADQTRDAATLAAIQALAAGGASIDTTAVINAIEAAAADTHQTITDLQAQLADTQARLAAALAAGGAADS